jgi:hypothetical protein
VSVTARRVFLGAALLAAAAVAVAFAAELVRPRRYAVHTSGYRPPVASPDNRVVLPVDEPDQQSAVP